MGEKKKAKKSEDGEGGGSKKKAARTTSNVFAMFTQHQVQEFKEAFQLIDQDKDGFISKNDIRATFDSLGRLCTEQELESMVSEAPGPINFTMFLTIFGDRVSGTDDEDIIHKAFALFDTGDGKMKEEALRKSLTMWGERMTNEELDDAFTDCNIQGGMIDIKKITKMITGGSDDAEPAA